MKKILIIGYFFLFVNLRFLQKMYMKKISILLLAFIAMFQIAQAQKGFHLIAKGGVNYGKIKGQNFKDGYNLGYHVGGSIEFDFTNAIGIQPEVLLSQVSISGNSAAPMPTQDSKLNYLSIPILLRINLGKVFTINLGPEYSILMSQEKTFVNNAGDAFKNGNFSAVAGFQLNLKTFRAHARYNIGLSDINELGNADNYKSEQIQVGIGIKLF